MQSVARKSETCLATTAKTGRNAMAKKKPAKTTKAVKPKADDPFKQYVILDAATMKTPPGRFLFVPIDTEDTANRMCWAIALGAYADALNVFGRKKHAMNVVQLAAEMANDTKMKHPELFRKASEGQNARNRKTNAGKPRADSH